LEEDRSNYASGARQQINAAFDAAEKAKDYLVENGYIVARDAPVVVAIGYRN